MLSQVKTGNTLYQSVLHNYFRIRVIILFSAKKVKDSYHPNSEVLYHFVCILDSG